MGRSASLLTHGVMRGGTSDAVALSFSTITYSPNTVTNKKPALGGLEKAQALRSLSDASMAAFALHHAAVSISDSHKPAQHSRTSRRLHHNWN